ncbi:hypothetical protein T10_11229 [Trichinella papuae]|uniref:Uncharacterized protein n=1 Tax=Trichinella papuae TaxID=268474 RepID=A0A0V1LXW0_9BILA|nr:hypothetical protein T10_11229 [Trichinella papuae]
MQITIAIKVPYHHGSVAKRSLSLLWRFGAAEVRF